MKQTFKIICEKKQNNTETQHICRHTAIRPGKISTMDMLIPVSSCAHNSSNTITLSTPQTVLTGWYKSQGPSCPETGPEPAYVTNVFIIQSSIFFNCTTWPFHTKPKSLRNWQPFKFNVNILSSPSCWVVQKNFSPGPTPVLGGADHVFKNICKITHLTGGRMGPIASLNILQKRKISCLCRELNPDHSFHNLACDCAVPKTGHVRAG